MNDIPLGDLRIGDRLVTPATLRDGDAFERARGLGRWLKVAMLARLRRERPQVQRDRTENASMNAPMRAINDVLGFRLVLTETVWQVETEVAAAALAALVR